MNKLDIAEDMTNNTDIKISYLQAESQQISINCLHWLVSESESVCIGYRLYQNIRTHIPRAPCPSIMGCLNALAACDGQTDFLESLINVSYRTSIIAMFYIQVQHYHSNSSKFANLLFLKPTKVWNSRLFNPISRSQTTFYMYSGRHWLKRRLFHTLH